jgi:hypothetical protein
MNIGGENIFRIVKELSYEIVEGKAQPPGAHVPFTDEKAVKWVFHNLSFDGLVKCENNLFCHSRENGNPGNSISSGLPLPAFAGTSFAGVTAVGASPGISFLFLLSLRRSYRLRLSFVLDYGESLKKSRISGWC